MIRLAVVLLVVAGGLAGVGWQARTAPVLERHQTGLRAVLAEGWPTPPVAGDPVAVLRIPTIGVDLVVVHGISVERLEQGPGHYAGTSLPGESGTVAVAGHRTTFGAPFGRLGELAPRDPIYLDTPKGTVTYRVVGTRIVEPDDMEPLAQTGTDRLVLSACHPKGDLTHRIIVEATR